MKSHLRSITAVLLLIVFMAGCGLTDIAREVVHGGTELVAFMKEQGGDVSKAESFLRGANTFLEGLDNAKSDGDKVKLLPLLASLTKSFRTEYKEELQKTLTGRLIAYGIDSALRRLSDKFIKIAEKITVPSPTPMSMSAELSVAQSAFNELQEFKQTKAVEKPEK